MSVRLRPLRREDDGWLREWLPAVADDAGSPLSDVQSLAAENATVRAVEVEGQRAGLVAWKPAGAEARFYLLALEPQSRRRGGGVDAAILAEREMTAAGARRVLAPVPESHGIAVYFWLRLGYRMLFRSQWPPCMGGGRIAWLGRELRPTGGGSND